MYLIPENHFDDVKESFLGFIRVSFDLVCFYVGLRGKGRKWVYVGINSNYLTHVRRCWPKLYPNSGYFTFLPYPYVLYLRVLSALSASSQLPQLHSSLPIISDNHLLTVSVDTYIICVRLSPINHSH